MAQTQEKQTGYFNATRADDGSTVKVLIYQTFYAGREADGTVMNMPGRPRYADRFGNVIKRVEKGKYTITIDGEDIEMTSSDPNSV